jgi:hypothetical protein
VIGVIYYIIRDRYLKRRRGAGLSAIADKPCRGGLNPPATGEIGCNVRAHLKVRPYRYLQKRV